MWTDRFPYLNFHELNLDWVLLELKNLIEHVKNHDEQIDDIYQKIADLNEIIKVIGDPELIKELIENYQAIVEQVNKNKDDITEINEKLNNTNATVVLLVNQINSLNTKVTELVSTTENHTQQINAINQTITSIQQTVESINNDLDGIHEELTSIVNSITNINNVNEQQNQEINNLKIEQNTQNTNIEKNATDIGELSRKLDAFDTDQGVINESLKERLDNLDRKDADFVEQLTVITQQIATIVQKNTEQDLKIHDVENNIVGLEDDISKINQRLDNLKILSYYGTNLLDLGFDLSGSTDMASKLQSLPSGVYYFQGNILIASPITITQHVTIIGNGINSVFIMDSSITVQAVQLMFLECHFFQNTQFGGTPFVLNLGSVFRNCEFHDFRDDAFIFNINNNSGYTNYFLNCKFYNCKEIVNSSNNILYFSNCYVHSTGEALYLNAMTLYFVDSYLYCNNDAINIESNCIIVFTNNQIRNANNPFSWSDNNANGIISGNFQREGLTPTILAPAITNVANSWNTSGGVVEENLIVTLDNNGVLLQSDNKSFYSYGDIFMFTWDFTFASSQSIYDGWRNLRFKITDKNGAVRQIKVMFTNAYKPNDTGDAPNLHPTIIGGSATNYYYSVGNYNTVANGLNQTNKTAIWTVIGIV